MATVAPKSRYVSFPCSGVLSEITTPSIVAGSALTACQNLTYHRQGAWGKRTGASQTTLPTGAGTSPSSGFRWYHAFPSPLTKLVTYANSTLSIGNDQHSLSSIGTFNLSGTTAPCFASMRDPQANFGQGSDIMIVTGLVLPTGSFGTGQITISGLPGSAPTSFWSVTVQNGAATPVQSAVYYTLATDDPSSIASNLVELLNETSAFLHVTGMAAPFINESYFTAPNLPYGALTSGGTVGSGAANPSATIYLGALISGAGGNSISYGINFTNPGGGGGTAGNLSVSPASAAPGTTNTSFTGGGLPWSGPARYDLTTGNLTGLSYMAPNAFTQCVTWHNHAFFWGDPNNPDTVFASDINQPEAFTFMIENGGMTGTDNGGYNIGVGDGDPGVQSCIPLGNGLYIFKTNNIYLIEGFDFQQGEYQFSVTPQVAGYGMPSPYCGAVLENEIVFWSGRKFLRLAVGAYEPEHIGFPIPLTEGLVSTGNQNLVRCVAGDLQVQTTLNNNFGPPNPYSGSIIIYRSMALWAVDVGTGTADTVIVYDDEATNNIGQYAWSPWVGWTVDCWIQQGNGPTPLGHNVDKPLVFFIDSTGTFINLVGGNAKFDWGNPISWFAQTGWVGFASDEVMKNAHRLFTTLECNNGVVFSGLIIPGQIIPYSGQVLPYSTVPVPIAFKPTIAPSGGESFNELEQYINPAVQAKSILMQFSEPGTAGAGFEMLSWGVDVNPQEGFQP